MERTTIPTTPAVLAIGAASARTALPGSALVRLVATSAAYINFGNSSNTAVATDIIAAPGIAEVFRVPTGATHIAALQVSAAGSLSIVGVSE